MTIFKLSNHNFLFLILLISFNFSNPLIVKHKKPHNSTLIQQEEVNDYCQIISGDENVTQMIVNNTLLISREYLDKHFFLFFLNRKDNYMTLKEFAQTVNVLFGDILELKFYCLDRNITDDVNLDANKENKFDSQSVYVIKEEKVIDIKKFKKFSAGYIDYLLNEFNLTQHVENKAEEIKKTNKDLKGQIQSFLQKSSKMQKMNQFSNFIEMNTKLNYITEKESKFKMNFMQTSINPTILEIKDKSFFVLSEQTTPNRFTRLLLALLLVTLSSFVCFLCVKSSVDWATSSQTELNKIKNNQMEEVTREVKGKFTYIVNTEA